MRKRASWASWRKEGQFLQAFMQNKANLRKAETSVCLDATKDYEKTVACRVYRNKAKQSQSFDPAQDRTKPILRLGSTSLTTGRSEPALSPFGYAQGKLCRRDRSSDYPCVVELAGYNLVLHKGNIMHSMPNGRDFDGEYVK